jgi:hypothetical protein
VIHLSVITMPALEIVGVVLGAISLLICIVQGHESAMGTLWAFRHWRVVLGRMRRGLMILMVSYNLTIRTLYAPFTSRAELEEMMEDTQSDLWRDSRILDGLRSQLGLAVTAYELLVLEIDRLINKLKELLHMKKLSTVSILMSSILATLPIFRT